MEVGREQRLVKLTGQARKDNPKLRVTWQKIPMARVLLPRNGLGRKRPCAGLWLPMFIGGQVARPMSGKRFGD